MIDKKSSVNTSAVKPSKKEKLTGTYQLAKAAKSMVNEAPAAYRSLYESPVSLLANSKKGLDAKAAFDFLQLSGFTQEQFQETFKTSVKTIRNYDRQETKLDPVLSEKLLKSFALFEKGVEVFGSAKDFNDWLHQPAFGLGNQIPFEMMDIITGISLVEEELIRITYGDLA